MLNPTRTSRGPAAFVARDWAFLSVALLVTSFFALGAHDLAIAHFGVPYPHDEAAPVWARYVAQVVRVGAVALIAHLGSWFLDRRGLVVAASIVGATLVLLHETVRVIIITIVVVEGVAHGSWPFVLIDALPAAIGHFFDGVAALMVARYLLAGRGRSVAGAAAAVLTAAAAGQFAMVPALTAAAAGIEQSLHLVEPVEFYQAPYSLYVYRFIYGTFIEPTLATFFLAFLNWPALPHGTGRRLAAFVAILLLVRGRVVSTGLLSFWVPQPMALAVAAEAQFLVETLIMALLVGAAWMVADGGLLRVRR